MAMQAAKSIKPEPVRDALAAADFETFYARIKFTPDGDGDALSLGGMIGQVQKGKLETVFPEKAKSADRDLPRADVGQEGVIAASVVDEPDRADLGRRPGAGRHLCACRRRLFADLRRAARDQSQPRHPGADGRLPGADLLRAPAHRPAAHHPAGHGRAVLHRLRLSASPDPARRRPRLGQLHAAHLRRRADAAERHDLGVLARHEEHHALLRLHLVPARPGQFRRRAGERARGKPGAALLPRAPAEILAARPGDPRHRAADDGGQALWRERAARLCAHLRGVRRLRRRRRHRDRHHPALLAQR